MFGNSAMHFQHPNIPTPYQKLAIPVLRRLPNTTLDDIANNVRNELSVTLAQVQSQSQDTLLCSARAMIVTRAI